MLPPEAFDVFVVVTFAVFLTLLVALGRWVLRIFYEGRYILELYFLFRDERTKEENDQTTPPDHQLPLRNDARAAGHEEDGCFPERSL